MADTEANRNQSTERAGTIKSLTSILKPPKLKIKRQHLARYSWLPDVFRYEGSTIPIIAGPVLTVTIFASIVAYLDAQGKAISLTNNVVPLLSVVVGLILVFRNSTSYDRWAEGRRDFSIMTANIRNLGRSIWITVNLPDDAEATARYVRSLPVYLQMPHLARAPSDTSSSTAHQIASAQNLGVADHLRQEKIRVIKLLVAFAIATKHHLRNEPGLDYEDYSGLIPPEIYRDESSGWERTTSPQDENFPTSTRTPAHSISQPGSKSRFNPLRRAATATTPLLADSQRATVTFHAYPERHPMALPLMWPDTYTTFKRLGCLDPVGPAMHNGMQALLQSMVDQLTSMERVSTTPIPRSCKSWSFLKAILMRAYIDSIHLKQAVTAFLFTLELRELRTRFKVRSGMIRMTIHLTNFVRNYERR
ncbi:hypothetical protein PIIN_00627 [Serendipita indica DSM 11827]|uniref:Uncharacterized protein n=1 Tax=Serendipita indica (strain DSM 11827) TaxID=1109443 RepID=G4T6C9_SERID|nr:hypothetical protein PIIN_00627 [Serendipita indica DSM 11827]